MSALLVGLVLGLIVMSLAVPLQVSSKCSGQTFYSRSSDLSCIECPGD